MSPEALGLGRVSVRGSETALEGGVDSVGLSGPQVHLRLVSRVARATVFSFLGTGYYVCGAPLELDACKSVASVLRVSCSPTARCHAGQTSRPTGLPVTFYFIASCFSLLFGPTPSWF